jgi:type I restriction enzyme M protein
MKKRPLTIEDFDEFFKLFNPSTLKLAEGERSWKVSIEDIKAKNYDLKAVNPNRKSEEDTRTPEELLNIIEEQGKVINESIKALRSKGITT